MKKEKKNNRRNFLKKSSLSVLSLSAFPTILKSENSKTELNKNSFSNTCNESTEDLYGQGPFYTANAPIIQNNQLANINEMGTRIIISGQVYNLECSEIIPNAEIDIWHANDSGSYDNYGFNLRGKTYSNAQGFYIFETIKPGLYLNGSTYRPSHIHFKITPPGFNTLITQLYFEGDPYIPTDAAASNTNGTFDATDRIIPLVLNGNGELEGVWDIIINGNGSPVGLGNLHLDKGIIYSGKPNPFIDSVEINYGVFQKANVRISVYDFKGKLVEVLQEKMLSPNKYSVIWNPKKNIAKGQYFISIMMNDLQVHYTKVFKQ